MSKAENESNNWGIIQDSFNSGIEELDLYAVFDTEEAAKKIAQQLNSTNKDEWLPDASMGTAYFVKKLQILGKVSTKVVIEYEDDHGNIFNFDNEKQ